MSERGRIVLRAPAKLNLGLEVTGKRPDGYHDLVTIFQAVEPSDMLTVGPAETEDDLLVTSDPMLDGPGNLAWRALALLREQFSVEGAVAAHLDKAIPAAAGMGGASSDAAAMLLAGRAIWGIPADDERLAALGASLGSDVPFFIRGGTALAGGTGNLLSPLPAPRAWFAIVSPAIEIERKTATLYGALRPDDFSDGSAVREQARRILAGLPIDPSLLVNAFTRPLLALRPDLAQVRDEIARAGGVPALSGAGPTHYAVFDDPAEAGAVAERLRGRLGRAARVFVSAPLPPSPAGGPDSASTD